MVNSKLVLPRFVARLALATKWIESGRHGAARVSHQCLAGQTCFAWIRSRKETEMFLVHRLILGKKRQIVPLGIIEGCQLPGSKITNEAMASRRGHSLEGGRAWRAWRGVAWCGFRGLASCVHCISAEAYGSSGYWDRWGCCSRAESTGLRRDRRCQAPVPGGLGLCISCISCISRGRCHGQKRE